VADPQAQALTREFQSQVLKVAALIAKRLRVTAMRADTSDIDGWWDSISAQVRDEILTGQSALAKLARGYLVQHALAQGVDLAPILATPDPEQVATALRVMGPVAFKTQMAISGSEVQATRVMATQLQGAATRLVLQGSRQTTMRTFSGRSQVAGWRRVAGRSSPCAFCLMLIGRGAVYSRESADFRTHDRCSCVPELLYQHEPEPPEVRQLQQQWHQATGGQSGKAALNAWRTFVAGQNT
jgi:hypothetical protein